MSAKTLPEASSAAPAGNDKEKPSFTESAVEWRRLYDTFWRARALSRAIRLLILMRSGGVLPEQEDPDVALFGMADMLDELLSGIANDGEHLIHRAGKGIYEDGIGEAAAAAGPFRAPIS